MTRNKTFTYLLLAALVAAPLALVPYLGATFLGVINAVGQEQGDHLPVEGDPVRLVTIPFLGSGRMDDALVAVIDLPSRNHATYLCQNSHHLNNSLLMYADANPGRTDRHTRVPGRDPKLAAALRETFPMVRIDAVRLLEPMAYRELHPQLEVFECRGQSYGRIARPSESGL